LKTFSSSSLTGEEQLASSPLEGEIILAPSPLAGEGRGEGAVGNRTQALHPTTFARHLRVSQTDAEKVLWHHLRDRQIEGCKFRSQQVIESFTVDFVCMEIKLIIELDGGQHQAQVSYDEARTRTLELNGFRVLRFWNNDVLQNTVSVLEVVRERCLAA
jgi:very-short-patch-repair endonuclease